MNLFAAIAVACGLIAIACYFYARVKCDRNVQLRYQVNMLVRQLDAEQRRAECLHRSIGLHLAESVILLAEHDRMTLRNAHLEAIHAQYKNVLAASMLRMATRATLPVISEMTVRKGEMP